MTKKTDAPEVDPLVTPDADNPPAEGKTGSITPTDVQPPVEPPVDVQPATEPAGPSGVLINVTEYYQGVPSNDRAITPGIYHDDDPALFGLADYLLKLGIARPLSVRG